VLAIDGIADAARHPGARASSMSMNGWLMGKANASAGGSQLSPIRRSTSTLPKKTKLVRLYKWSATNVAPSFLPNLLAIRRRRELA
jgi:hypothetical protein